jgi:hypothetical protein
MSMPLERDRSRCACARCPSYLQGDSALFCVHDRSTLKVQERGCLCRTCPVHLEYQLSGRFFCIRGKPKG